MKTEGMQKIGDLWRVTIWLGPVLADLGWYTSFETAYAAYVTAAEYVDSDEPVEVNIGD